MRLIILLLATSFGSLAVTATPAIAHPHGWIDLKTEIVVDDDGRLTAIRQAWLFDAMYSAFMFGEFEAADLDREEGLAVLLREDVAALAPHDYFTRVEVDGERQPTGEARAYANGVAEQRLWFRFELPLVEPVPLDASDIRYAVYDPTYYIEMKHRGDEPVRLADAAPGGCDVALAEPDPPSEIAAFAASLDRTQQADEGIGVYFAEWVDIRCVAPD